MLPVSAVYVRWQEHGDMVDAYYLKAQIVMMQQISTHKNGMFAVLTRNPYFDCYFQWLLLNGTEKLEIREDVEGIAA
jgi:hypothetical protein